MLKRAFSSFATYAGLVSMFIFLAAGCSSGPNSTASTSNPPGGSAGGGGTGSGGGSTGGGSGSTGGSGGTGGSGSTGGGSGSTGGSGSGGSGSSGGGGGSTGGGTGSGGGTGGTGSGSGSGSGGGGTTTTSASEYLYMVAYEQQGPVYEFQIDPATGILTQMTGSPFLADVGSPTQVCSVGCGASLVADPLNRFVFLQYNYGNLSGTPQNAVDSLNVNAQNGTLSSNSKVLQAAYQLSVDPQGRFLYQDQSFGGPTNAVGGFDVSSTGQLTTAPGQPYTYNGQTSYGAPAVTANNVFAINYRDVGTTTSQGELVEWTIDPTTGALTQTTHTLPLTEGGNPIVTPNGKFLYVQQAYLSNGVFYWELLPIQINADGSFTALTQNVQQTPGQGPSNVWMSPNGNFLYISVAQQLWDYQIDQTTGALTLVQKYTDISTNTLAIDPAVKYVFLSPDGPNSVGTTMLTTYSVDPATGALTPVANGTIDTKVLPISLAVISPK